MEIFRKVISTVEPINRILKIPIDRWEMWSLPWNPQSQLGLPRKQAEEGS
jgi:hypothetical protein